ARSPGEYRRILVGVDGSPTADEAARKAYDLSVMVGARLSLVSVGEPLMAGVVLRDAAERLGGRRIETVALRGDPSTRISEAAAGVQAGVEPRGASVGLPVRRIAVRLTGQGDPRAGQGRARAGGGRRTRMTAGSAGRLPIGLSSVTRASSGEEMGMEIAREQD